MLAFLVFMSAPLLSRTESATRLFANGKGAAPHRMDRQSYPFIDKPQILLQLMQGHIEAAECRSGITEPMGGRGGSLQLRLCRAEGISDHREWETTRRLSLRLRGGGIAGFQRWCMGQFPAAVIEVMPVSQKHAGRHTHMSEDLNGAVAVPGAERRVRPRVLRHERATAHGVPQGKQHRTRGLAIFSHSLPLPRPAPPSPTPP
eukprot:989939-Rhodomonas_salina.1